MAYRYLPYISLALWFLPLLSMDNGRANLLLVYCLYVICFCCVTSPRGPCILLSSAGWEGVFNFLFIFIKLGKNYLISNENLPLSRKKGFLPFLGTFLTSYNLSYIKSMVPYRLVAIVVGF